MCYTMLQCISSDFRIHSITKCWHTDNNVPEKSKELQTSRSNDEL